MDPLGKRKHKISPEKIRSGGRRDGERGEGEGSGEHEGMG